jgi:hypothetical protein
MSNLKQFTSKIENISTGEIVSALPADETFFESQEFLKCDGSIVLQSSYPYLYENIGHLESPPTSYDANTEFILPTSNSYFDIYIKT